MHLYRAMFEPRLKERPKRRLEGHVSGSRGSLGTVHFASSFRSEHNYREVGVAKTVRRLKAPETSDETVCGTRDPDDGCI